MNADHYAKEAERLLEDEVLAFAFDTIKARALEDLVSADADDKTSILRLQQTVQVIDGIRSELRAAIARRASQATSMGTVA